MGVCPLLLLFGLALGVLAQDHFPIPSKTFFFFFWESLKEETIFFPFVMIKTYSYCITLSYISKLLHYIVVGIFVHALCASPPEEVRDLVIDSHCCSPKDVVCVYILLQNPEQNHVEGYTCGCAIWLLP